MNKKINATINWSNPFDIKNINDDIKYNRGIYQVSQINQKGNEELLYIGLVKSNDRTFQQRIKEHLFDENKPDFHKEKTCVRFGIIELQDYKIDDEHIEAIEGALIFHNIPKDNKSKISYYSKNYEYMIKQVNNIENLNTEIDTSKHYFTTDTMQSHETKYLNYSEAIENFKKELMQGKVYIFKTPSLKSPFNCYMEPNKITLWFVTSGGQRRYTTFKNIERYFKGEAVRDERIYIKTIAKFLEQRMDT